MGQVIVGLYDQHSDAQAAFDDLMALGVDRTSVDMISSNSGDMSILNQLPSAVPQRDREFYQQGVRDGGSLLVVRVADAMAEQAVEVMERYNIVDINDRMQRSGFGSSKLGDQTSATFDATSADDTVLPVVEEELRVGKRQVERGRTRVHTHVEETPVEEQVHLRDETVRVERRPVDRVATDADLNAFQEGEIEITETDEEAIIDKQARVVEEVRVRKDVEDRTETIRDTVRRTDVQVDKMGSERAVGETQLSGYDAYDNEFRSYFQSNLTDSGYTYDQYNPVFRYGHSLGSDSRYHGDWSTVEPEARRYWEEQNPGTWESVKDSVRYAWDRVRGRR
jgi:uncharacterized protein (TIGR02271 family)